MAHNSTERAGAGIYKVAHAAQTISGRKQMRNVYETDERVIYRKRDIRRLRRKYKPGQKITVMTINVNGEEAAKPKREVLTVARAFPNFLSCIDESGFRRSIKYVDMERIIVR